MGSEWLEGHRDAPEPMPRSRIVGLSPRLGLGFSFATSSLREGVGVDKLPEAFRLASLDVETASDVNETPTAFDMPEILGAIMEATDPTPPRPQVARCSVVALVDALDGRPAGLIGAYVERLCGADAGLARGDATGEPRMPRAAAKCAPQSTLATAWLQLTLSTAAERFRKRMSLAAVCDAARPRS